MLRTVYVAGIVICIPFRRKMKEYKSTAMKVYRSRYLRLSLPCDGSNMPRAMRTLCVSSLEDQKEEMRWDFLVQKEIKRH
jgi:hypothetical protein